MEEKGGSVVLKATGILKEEIVRLRKYGITMNVPDIIEEIRRILLRIAQTEDPELIRKVFLNSMEEDRDLIEFVRQEIGDIDDPTAKMVSAQEAIREYIYKNPDRLVNWILQKIYVDIS